MNKPGLMNELGEEHMRLLATAPRLSQLLQTLEQSPEDSQDETEDFLAELKGFRGELLNHFRREEALFAAVRQEIAKADPGTDVLIAFLSGEAESDLQAHGALTSQTGKMVALLNEQSPAYGMAPEVRKRLRELLDTTLKLLHSHAASEDQIIFPIIVHVLRTEKIAEIREQLQPADEDRRFLLNP